MTDISPKLPRLRFPEFNEPWPVHRLDWALKRMSATVDVVPTDTYREIGVRSHGKGIFHKEPVSGASLGEKRVFWVQPAAFVVNIVFAWEQAVAVTSEAEKGFIASHRFPMFQARAGRADVRFIRDFFLRKRGKYLLELASPGGAGRNKTLGQADFAALPLPLPSRSEQQKISDFLELVDARAAILLRKMNELTRYKRELARRLFNQELRFTRHDGSNFPEWRTIHLRDVATFVKGRGISKDDVSSNGKVPCIRYGELYTEYGERITRVKSATNAPERELLLSKLGDVILPASGETPLDMASASCVEIAGVALGGDINVIRSPIHGVFLAYLLRGPLRRSVARLAQGNSVVHLYGSHLAEVKLSVPTEIEEQRIIASFLTVLDDKIGSIRAKIGVMHALKKGLLQQMFA